MSWGQARQRIRDVLLGVKITNLVDNPSFETDIVGAFPDGTLTAVHDPAVGKFGTGSLKVTGSAAAVETVFFRKRDGNRFDVTAGLPYTFSLYVKTGATTLWGGHIGIRCYDSGGVSVPGDGLFYGLGVTPSGLFSLTQNQDWTRLTWTRVIPAGAVTAEVDIEESIGWGAGEEVWIDGVMFIQGGDIAYIDGTQPGCRWTGTANASTSELYINQVHDNPPLPAEISASPCFIIFPPETTTLRPSAGWRIDTHTVRLTCLFRDQELARAFGWADALRQAIYDAFDADTRLNELCTIITGPEITPVESQPYGREGRYTGMDCNLTVRIDSATEFAA